MQIRAASDALIQICIEGVQSLSVGNLSDRLVKSSIRTMIAVRVLLNRSDIPRPRLCATACPAVSKDGNQAKYCNSQTTTAPQLPCNTGGSQSTFTHVPRKARTSLSLTVGRGPALLRPRLPDPGILLGGPGLWGPGSIHGEPHHDDRLVIVGEGDGTP
jgi:hypothetical protein